MEGVLIILGFAGVLLLVAVMGGGPDRTRDKLCAGMQAMGVDARMAERGRLEEKTGEGSLGVLDIAQGPIRWINVREEGSGEDHGYITEYGVPDQRHLPQLQIRSIRVKTFPVIGRVVDVRWEGTDGDLDILQRLSNDQAIKHSIMVTKDEVTVVTRHDRGCWLVVRKTAATPSPEQWRCYQGIAERLLATLLPASVRWTSKSQRMRG